MYIFLTEHNGADVSTNIIDTNLLSASFKYEVEQIFATTKMAQMFEKQGDDYGEQFDSAIVLPTKVLPAVIEGMMDLFVD